MRRATLLLLAASFMVCAANPADARYRHTGKLNIWTTREVSRINAPDGQMRIVRVASQKSFDRVVFEFADGVPSFSIKYAKPPIYDEGTMKPIEISGASPLVVTFAFYYGEHTEIYQGFPKGKLDLSVLREIKNIDSSEGVMSYALDLQTRHPFRVTTLTNPARLVVDIKH
jgi:hypothetical protein